MAAVTTAVIAGGAAAYSIYNAEEQKKDAKKAANDQARRMAGLEAEAKQQAKNKETTAAATEVRDNAAKIQRGKAGASANRSGTLVTSPLGLIGQPASAGKTLIGQ